MSRRPRRNHKPAFKAKVALEAMKGEYTMVELTKRHDLHANQITQWKVQLLERMGEVFDRPGQESKEPDIDVKALHAKIGELTLENDFCLVSKIRGLAQVQEASPTHDTTRFQYI